MTGRILQGPLQKETCPHECCLDGGEYQVRVCQGENYKCINNKCVKDACPYECCPEGEFSAKSCQSDYACISNKCVAIDTDKDGLTDIEEKEIGTNPNLYDSDGDTLSDYKEYKVLGTNPLNVNSDGDRYDDNADPDPKNKNSASISVSVINEDFGIDWINIVAAFVGGGLLNPDLIIARPKVTISVTNNGNDYSSFLNYDVVFIISETEVKRFNAQKGRVEMNAKSVTEMQDYQLKARDVPALLYNIITKQSTDWDVKIENIRYETF